MMRTVLMLVAALALTAFDMAPQVSEPRFAPGTAAILPEAKARAVVDQCSRAAPTPEGTWLPTPDQIVALEPALAKLVAAKLNDAEVGNAEAKVGGYYRQYAGLIVGGKKIVYVNGFPAQSAKDLAARNIDWRTEPVMVCDGGWSFFGVEYDLNSGVFANFNFNGFA